MAVKQTSLRLEEDLLKKVKVICVNQGTTFQEVVGKLLIKWVEDQEKQQQKE